MSDQSDRPKNVNIADLGTQVNSVKHKGRCVKGCGKLNLFSAVCRSNEGKGD